MPIVVGICTIELYLPNNSSLKEKRQVLRSMKDRVKRNFNVSFAEIDCMDLWQKAVLGIACVGNEKGYVNRTLDKSVAMIREIPVVEMIDSRFEFV